jgi:hypothetical protein
MPPTATETSPMNDQKPEKKTEPEINIPFEDEKAMYGTSPINKELTDEEVEYLTARTARRVVLTKSRRKTFLYTGSAVCFMFLVRLLYHRAAPATGMLVPPVFGLDETGLALVCAAISVLNLFLIPPQEKNVQWLTRFLGTGLPLLALALLYLLPPDVLYRYLRFLF